MSDPRPAPAHAEHELPASALSALADCVQRLIEADRERQSAQ